MSPRLCLVSLFALSPLLPAQDSTTQPAPQVMAEAAAVTLPRLPWHVANIWWNFEKPIEDFQSLEIDITVDRDLSTDYNLYLSPCGIAQINGLDFYGGIQSNINGWADRETKERVTRGKGGIFSRWSHDKKTPIGLEHVRTAGDDCLVESAGYEGEFASVRRPFPWNKGTYTWSITKGATEEVDGKSSTWFICRVKAADGDAVEIGSLRFEGTKFTYWAKHSAFVEVYGTAKIPKPGIPKINVLFSAPRLNGAVPPMKSVNAYYPDQGGPASPDCAWIKKSGDSCLVEVGPIFKRDESKRRHPVVADPAP